jgi:hypothetical protein
VPSSKGLILVEREGKKVPRTIEPIAYVQCNLSVSGRAPIIKAMKNQLSPEAEMAYSVMGR